MNKIKMSEVFKDRQASYSVSMSDKQCLAAQHAIDSYDANQERIKELEGIAFKLQEFIVETYNQYNTDRNLGIKISLRGGALITESESILEQSK